MKCLVAGLYNRLIDKLDAWVGCQPGLDPVAETCPVFCKSGREDLHAVQRWKRGHGSRSLVPREPGEQTQRAHKNVEQSGKEHHCAQDRIRKIGVVEHIAGGVDQHQTTEQPNAQ